MQRFIDGVLRLAKWPVALGSLVLVPGLLLAWGDVVLPMLTSAAALPLLAGFFAYLVGWFLIFRHHLAGSLLPTFLHELTHALFALLTFHPVGGLRASWSDGGRIMIGGRPSWCVLLAPYFFPLAPLLMAALMLWGPEFGAWVWESAFGVSVAFHLATTLRQTHRGQTDLQRTGFFFASCFLPSANLLSFGLLLSTLLGGYDAWGAFLARVALGTRQMLALFLG